MSKESPVALLLLLGPPLSKAPLSTGRGAPVGRGGSRPLAPQVGATSAPLACKGAERCSE